MHNTNSNAQSRDTHWKARGFKTEAERHLAKPLPESPQAAS